MSSFRNRRLVGTDAEEEGMLASAPDSSGGFWSIERVVAALTPVFAGVSGYATTIVGKLVPGVSFSPTDFVVLFGLGATAAASGALKWLHGRQQFVHFETDAEKNARYVEAAVRKVVAENPAAAASLADIERVLEAHEAQIVAAVGSAAHLPPSAEAIATQVVLRLLPGGQEAPAAAAQAAQGAAGTQ